jgi:hypothetical protein
MGNEFDGDQAWLGCFAPLFFAAATLRSIILTDSTSRGCAISFFTLASNASADFFFAFVPSTFQS